MKNARLFDLLRLHWQKGTSKMIALIEDNREEIERLCSQYRVQRLEVFGSALTDKHFDAENSDLDFLVKFLSLQPGEHADAYFGLLEAMQDMFSRHIDLVMTRAIKNPYFLESVNKCREVIYAA
jgi:predicted nucleotidyltransferase